MRPSKRKNDQIREVEIQTNVNKYAEGSCLIKIGNTHVLCTASVEEKTPPFLRNTGKGWVTAEYAMLPRSTHHRNQRAGIKPNGRALEIQRLIARSLRSVINLSLLGERQITVDCDVIQADGGTRCASITGGYVALKLAISKLLKDRVLHEDPIHESISAISCGIYKGEVVADLDYDEDSNCEIDANFVINSKGNIIEVQATAEDGELSFEDLAKMYEMAKNGCDELKEKQDRSI